MFKKSCPTLVAIGILFLSYRLSAQSGPVTHPVLLSPVHLSALQTAGNTEWTGIKSFCDNNLNSIIDPSYAGEAWHQALIDYATAYQVIKSSDPTTANKYAMKALALMKVMARHHNYGGPMQKKDTYYDGYQFVGLGDGSTKNFPIPFPTLFPGSKIQVTFSPIATTSLTYNKNQVQLAHFEPILTISNSNGGAADYDTTDYQFLYTNGRSNDDTQIYKLIWGATHPANGATYYVTQTSGLATSPVSTGFSSSSSQISFTTAPAAGQAVFVRMMDASYNQTGNFMGGLSAAQPDDGYQMRNFNPALSYGIDLLYGYSGLTPDLVTEFVNVINTQITWYNNYGYENEGVDFGNYFIEGLVTSTVYAAYGTDGVNASVQQYKGATKSYLQDRIFADLNTQLPGGYGPQGQYTNAVFSDIITLFALYKDVSGTDLFSQSEWVDNVVRASIHGTKPDRKTFYDGGDWSDLPATPMTDMINTYLAFLPNNPMAPYARQYLRDVNAGPVPPGAVTDYKTSFPLSYFCRVSSPVYARSDWSTNAVWMSFVSSVIIGDHQHLDQGHFSIQKGGDYLLINGGQYGALSTIYNNTLLFDDRGAGDISVYPPGQGYWGTTDQVTKYEASANYVYSHADFTSAYRSNNGKANSVTEANRSVLFIHPGIILVHDKANVKNKDVKKIFNLNFPVTPVQKGDVYTVAVNQSNLFVKSLLPNTTAAVISPIKEPYDPQEPQFRNFQVTKSGALQDNFFYAFEATNRSQTVMSNITYADGGSFESAATMVGDTTWTAVFPKQGGIAAKQKLDYLSPATGNHHDLITDVAPGTDFAVTVLSGSQRILDSVLIKSSDQGVLSFVYTTNGSQGAVFINDSTHAIAAPPATPPGSGSAYGYYVWADAGRIIHVTFSLGGAVTAGICLRDISGRMITRQSAALSGGQTTINLNSGRLSSGIYVVEVVMNGGPTSKKLFLK